MGCGGSKKQPSPKNEPGSGEKVAEKSAEKAKSLEPTKETTVAAADLSQTKAQPTKISEANNANIQSTSAVSQHAKAEVVHEKPVQKSVAPVLLQNDAAVKNVEAPVQKPAIQATPHKHEELKSHVVQQHTSTHAAAEKHHDHTDDSKHHHAALAVPPESAREKILKSGDDRPRDDHTSSDQTYDNWLAEIDQYIQEISNFFVNWEPFNSLWDKYEDGQPRFTTDPTVVDDEYMKQYSPHLPGIEELSKNKDGSKRWTARADYSVSSTDIEKYETPMQGFRDLSCDANGNPRFKMEFEDYDPTAYPTLPLVYEV